MIECSKCHQNYKVPGHHCPECDAREERKAREKAEAAEAGKQRVNKEDENRWYRNHYERKKPGSEVVDQAVTEPHVGPV